MSKREPKSKPASPSSPSEGAITLQNSRAFSLEGREMPVKVLQVIDGNTVILGFHLFREAWNMPCRWANFVCASTRSRNPVERAAAVRARDFVEHLLVDQVASAKFGAMEHGKQTVILTLLDGRELSRIMIAEGHAGSTK